MDSATVEVPMFALLSSRSAAVTLGLALISTPALAQNANETAGYFATLITPAGALPGWVTPGMAYAHGNGIGIRTGYGRVRLESTPPIDLNSFGGSLDFTLLGGRLTLSGTGGYLFPHCPGGGGFLVGADCDGFAMAGAELTARVLSYEVNTDGHGILTVALAARGGKAFVKSSSAYSLSAALPISMAVDVGRTTLLVPFVSPGATRGHLRTSVGTDLPDSLGGATGAIDATGTRFVLSGGMALLGTRSGLGLHATVTRIFIEGGRTQFGVSLSWNSVPFGWPSRRPPGRY
ncbi:MAG TPA: hypothetical protein VFR95_01405 [Gemmatimonadaceae bacterium]|nr:hypothetical protein [Gemmatimonadaceae bacterium]